MEVLSLYMVVNSISISQHQAEHDSDRVLLGISEEKSELQMDSTAPIWDLIRFREAARKNRAISILSANGSCPSLISDATTHEVFKDSFALSPLLSPLAHNLLRSKIEASSVEAQSYVKWSLGNSLHSTVDTLHIGDQFSSVRGRPTTSVSTLDNLIDHATNSKQFTPGSISSIDKAKHDSKVPNGIYDITMAAFRGQPELLPQVHGILNTSGLYRTFAGRNKRSSSESISLSSAQTPRKSPKNRRVADVHGGMPEDENPLHVKLVEIDEENGIRPELRFECAFHKVWPAIYCAQTWFGGTGNLYRTCAGNGYTTAHHLLDHYIKKHGRPQCLNCLAIFRNTGNLTQHQREGGCVRNSDRSREEPIDPAKELRIRSASHHARAEALWTTDEIRWYKFFFILFPLMIAPRSPYVGQGGEAIVLHVLSNLLESRSLANRDNNNTIIFNTAITYIQQLVGWLGPALEEDDNLRDAAAPNNSSQAFIVHETTSNVTEAYNQDLGGNIDPALMLLQARQQIRDMPYSQNTEQGQVQPVFQSPRSQSNDGPQGISGGG